MSMHWKWGVSFVFSLRWFEDTTKVSKSARWSRCTERNMSCTSSGCSVRGYRHPVHVGIHPSKAGPGLGGGGHIAWCSCQSCWRVGAVYTGDPGRDLLGEVRKAWWSHSRPHFPTRSCAEERAFPVALTHPVGYDVPPLNSHFRHWIAGSLPSFRSLGLNGRALTLWSLYCPVAGRGMQCFLMRLPARG